MPPIRSLTVFAYSTRVRSRIGEGPGSMFVPHRLAGGGPWSVLPPLPAPPLLEPPEELPMLPLPLPGPGRLPFDPGAVSPLIVPVHEEATRPRTRVARATRGERRADLHMRYSWWTSADVSDPIGSWSVTSCLV